MYSRIVLAVGFAAVGVAVLIPIAIGVLSRHGIVDLPNQRSSHVRPTARGAGMVTGTVLAISLSIGHDRVTFSLALVAMFATILGGVEDLHGCGITARLATQTAIGVLFLALTLGIGTTLPKLVLFCSLVFIVAYTNAFNFMDGINGISAVSAAIAGTAFIAAGHLRGVPDLTFPAASLVATAICFLPYNFPRARVFLGDSGSYSFGIVIACIVVVGWRAGVSLDVLLAPLAVYMADTGTVVLRRLMRRERLSEPHRQHIYQRLVQLGVSHRGSTACVAAFSATTSCLGLAAINAGPTGHLVADSVVIGVAAIYLVLPNVLVMWHPPSSRAQS